MPKLFIILVNYKRAQDTSECITSLQKSSFKNFNILIVDNGSCDGSVKFLQNHHPDANIFESKTNLGFAAGNNLGVQYALHQQCKYILLLNNDTIVDESMLKVLIHTMEQNPQAGIIGAKIYYFDRQNVLWFAGGTLKVHSAMGLHVGIGEVDKGQYDEVRASDYITGCCLLARREVYETIGVFDHTYFAYLEDADFCLRARQAGYLILYQPRAIVYHKISSTSSWDSPVYLYFNLRNKILFLRKHSRPREWLPHLPQLIYFYGRQFIRLIFKWHDVSSTRAAWFGLIDGLRNFTGEQGEGRLCALSSKK